MNINENYHTHPIKLHIDKLKYKLFEYIKLLKSRNEI